MDRILTAREIPFLRLTGKYQKKLRLADLLCRDMQINPRVIRPRPIYIDWQNDCRFTGSIPGERLNEYRTAGETAFAKDRGIYARVPDLRTR
jgi:hypothetical protein